MSEQQQVHLTAPVPSGGAKTALHTPGPWHWRQSSSGRVDLAAPHGGGTVVMDFVRHGMNGAQPRFALCDDGAPRAMRGGILQNITALIDAHPERRLDHPDALLIAAAPDLLAALSDCVIALAHLQDTMSLRVNPPTLENARAAIAKAESA